MLSEKTSEIWILYGEWKELHEKSLFSKIAQFQNPRLTNTALGWRQFAVSSEWPTESSQPQSRYQYDSACCCPNPWTIATCDVTSNYRRSGDGSYRPIHHCYQLPERIRRGASEWSYITFYIKLFILVLPGSWNL